MAAPGTCAATAWSLTHGAGQRAFPKWAQVDMAKELNDCELPGYERDKRVAVLTVLPGLVFFGVFEGLRGAE